jgi:uncharacterized membrane protein
MVTFSAWQFDTIDGAEHARQILARAETDGLVKVHDSAIVSWPQGTDRPTTSHRNEDTWRGSGWGAMWGMLLGALFFVPVLGAAAGAATGALVKALNGLGISSDQLDRIRASVVPGTSALFLVTEPRNMDRLAERFRGVHAKLVETNLSGAEAAERYEGLDLR